MVEWRRRGRSGSGGAAAAAVVEIGALCRDRVVVPVSGVVVVNAAFTASPPLAFNAAPTLIAAAAAVPGESSTPPSLLPPHLAFNAGGTAPHQ